MTVGGRRVVVTGAAGFIGFHLSRRLLADGDSILGIDNLDPYYDVGLKQARLAQLAPHASFRFEQADLTNGRRLHSLFDEFRPTEVVHLAAQAGVRYSLDNPRAYLASNVDGFLNVLEACRHHPVLHLVYASSSSVYGANADVPFREDDRVDRPVSLYAATKRAGELMAYTYSHLFGTPMTGLRFFTVYGPWGRPDMAYFKFTKAILEGRTIDIFNQGRMSRDFTYIDDIVEALVRLVDHPPRAEGAEPPHAIYNIGNHTPVELERFVDILANAIGREPKVVYQPMQPGEVTTTFANVDRLSAAVGFAPTTPIEHGLREFVAWYRDFHGERAAAVPRGGFTG